MVQLIENKNTIIDYLNTVEQYSDVTGKKFPVIALNRDEWTQLVNLYATNYNNCQGTLSLDNNGTWGQFKTFTLYYDGSPAKGKLEYVNGLLSMADHIERTLQVAQEMHNITEAGAARQANRIPAIPNNWAASLQGLDGATAVYDPRPQREPDTSPPTAVGGTTTGILNRPF